MHLKIKINTSKKQIESGEIWLDSLVSEEKNSNEAIETLLTAYEKEKEKNKELRNQLNTIKDIYYNTNDLEELSDVLGVLLSNLKEE